MISFRHAAPPQVSALGIQLLPPNQAVLRLELVQSMPTPLPSASFVTFVNQSRLASAAPNGMSTWKPMKAFHGACRTKRQKYSSSGSCAFGMTPALTYCVALTGMTAEKLRPCPLGLTHGNRNRLPAEYVPRLPRTKVMLTAPARPR